MWQTGQQQTLDDNGNFLNWFVGEPKVERAIAYETRAPSEARLPYNGFSATSLSYVCGFEGSSGALGYDIS